MESKQPKQQKQIKKKKKETGELTLLPLKIITIPPETLETMLYWQKDRHTHQQNRIQFRNKHGH